MQKSATARPASDLKPLAAQSACVRDYLATLPAAACSCSNAGDLLQKAARSPVIVCARVVRHEPARAQMVVQGLELWQGGWLDSRVVALSHCGEHALRIVDGRALSASHPGGWPLHELRERVSTPCYALRWHAALRAGERWQRRLPDGLDVVLEPRRWCGEIMAAEPRRPEADNLARLTPPLHFQPNPREIEGWHFMRNPRRCKSRPYQAEAGPDNLRLFIVSPAVDRRSNRCVWGGRIGRVARRSSN